MTTGTKLIFAILALAFCLTATPCFATGSLTNNIKAAEQHWAFQPLRPSANSPAASRSGAPNLIDRFIRARLSKAGLSPGPAASRESLIRRVAFSLTGLPPTPAEIEQYLADRKPRAYERLVEHYLQSPAYGERGAKHWLDTAGYADSNGYFNADSDRPLAYRYRDYVIRSFNQNKPFDAFVREQLAGDELSGWRPGQPATPGIIELLEATHYLRNGQDGSGESDGNPDEVRIDRYTALESSMQIIGSSLLGLTIQCAKCHDHKFEPITQKDYYSFQAFLYPAFNIEKWIKPNDRVIEALPAGERERWQAKEKSIEAEQAALKKEFAEWVAAHRPSGRLAFEDQFDTLGSLARRWSNAAPGDDTPGGTPAVALDGEMGPAARAAAGALQIIEGGGAGDRWISTRTAFNWRPEKTNDWIQASFDLVASRLNNEGANAERIGWFIALHDFNHNSKTTGGNILIDGHPGGPTSVIVDYPGSGSSSRGNIGALGYVPGHNYGVRITKTGADKFLMEHLVDGAPDGASLTLKGEDLPPGGFGFEYCCGRSFIVDNVRVEVSRSEDSDWLTQNSAFLKDLAEYKKGFDRRNQSIADRRSPPPGRVAWVGEVGDLAPKVYLLKRGNHKTPGEEVEPAFPAFLMANPKAKPASDIEKTAGSTGRRLAWAKWITEPGSTQAALLARVTVNRIWQQHFGTGLVATPDNLGLSGARPTHPELLEWLAAEFVASGWNVKSLHTLILESATFRQSSAPRASGLKRDAADQLLWRYPVRRLDAESIRDAILAASGRLGPKTQGPYVPTSRSGVGEVILDETKPDAFSRSIFLQQRRSQVATLLSLFDAPSIVFNCSRRASTTMPLQSLSLLNSEFAVLRGEDLAQRLERECGPDAVSRIRHAFRLTASRAPDTVELKAARQFLDDQRRAYADKPDAEKHVWADFCQSLFALNSFLYLE